MPRIRASQRVDRAYLDTAFILRCYLDEAGAQEVREFAHQVNQLISGEHARAEFVAALHRTLREKRISTVQFRATLAQFHDDIRWGIWTFVPITAKVCARVEDVFADLPASVALRAADALHCACARDTGLDVLYSNDRKLLDGAKFFGLTGVNLIPS
jgi:predicted nucleic acid-binding protein